MERLLEEARAALHHLPPGPWTAYGTTVYAGSTVVAQVPKQGWEGERIARTLAQLPDLIHLLVVTGPDTLMGRLQEQDEKIEQLEDKIIDLEVDLKIATEKVNRCDEMGA